MTNQSLNSSLAVWLLLIAVTCCLLTDHVTASSSVPVVKRETRRYPRAKYRVGYMFGKRSSADAPSSTLLDALTRNTMSKSQLESFLLRNPEVLSEISTILDRNVTRSSKQQYTDQVEIEEAKANANYGQME